MKHPSDRQVARADVPVAVSVAVRAPAQRIVAAMEGAKLRSVVPRAVRVLAPLAQAALARPRPSGRGSERTVGHSSA